MHIKFLLSSHTFQMQNPPQIGRTRGSRRSANPSKTNTRTASGARSPSKPFCPTAQRKGATPQPLLSNRQDYNAVVKSYKEELSARCKVIRQLERVIVRKNLRDQQLSQELRGLRGVKKQLEEEILCKKRLEKQLKEMKKSNSCNVSKDEMMKLTLHNQALKSTNAYLRQKISQAQKSAESYRQDLISIKIRLYEKHFNHPRIVITSETSSYLFDPEEQKAIRERAAKKLAVIEKYDKEENLEAIIEEQQQYLEENLETETMREEEQQDQISEANCYISSQQEDNLDQRSNKEEDKA